MKILILSTVHRWNDPRIFHKEACSLAGEHDVTLAAVDDGPVRRVNGVMVQPLGVWRSRFDRVKLWWKAYVEILKSGADVIHFHDPELALVLLPCALVGNKCMVCDVHEHPYAAIGGREWIPRPIRRMSAAFFGKLLTTTPTIYDQVILAEESYGALFPKRDNVHLIRNYALIPKPDVSFPDRYADFDPRVELHLLYVGSITESRGAVVLVDAVQSLMEKYPGISLDLVGQTRPASLENTLRKRAANSGGRIRLHGYLDFTAMNPLMKKAHLGLIPLQPHPNFERSLATKFFDYMIYGLPCIASDFPLWQSFIAENACGITANLTSPKSLADAVERLAGDADMLRTFSRNAYTLVRERFNWDKEGEKLLGIYRGLS
jgi:glycosyltransferase involved in cell wall biosynthesis